MQTFTVSDICWWREVRIEPGSLSKLKKLFRRPMEITEISSQQDVRIRDYDTKIEVKGPVAINSI